MPYRQHQQTEWNLPAVLQGSAQLNDGISYQRVAPLFETLTDLDNAGTVMRRLFSIPWYREHLR